MSLEQALAANTAALETLAAIMSKAGGATPAASAAKAEKAEKPAAKGYTPKYEKGAMQALLAEVKEKIGTPVAKALIKDIGKVDKMAEITDPEVIDAVYVAAKAKLTEAEEAM